MVRIKDWISDVMLVFQRWKLHNNSAFPSEKKIFFTCPGQADSLYVPILKVFKCFLFKSSEV